MSPSIVLASATPESPRRAGTGCAGTLRQRGQVRRRRGWPLGLIVLLVCLLGCGGGGAGGANTSGWAGAPPAIQRFAATAPVITAGESTSLEWNTTGATTLDIRPLGSFPTASGSVAVSPAATTTYTLVAANAQGSASASATVTVNYRVAFQAGAGGKLSGNALQTVPAGGTCSPVTAIPDPGYTFAGWSGNGLAPGTTNPLSVANVTSNLSLTATFVGQTCTVTFLAGPGGTLTGATSQVVPYGGTTSPVTAVPEAGFGFAGWTGPGLPSTTANPLVLPNVTTDLTVTAGFTPLSFTVTFLAGTGGTLTGATSQVVPAGGSCTPVTAVAAPGFLFTQWTGNGFTSSVQNPLEVTGVMANLTITANFGPTFATVTFQAGPGGSLAGNASQVIAYGGTCTPVTAVPAGNYTFTGWTGPGGFASSANPLVLADVRADTTITANFALKSFSVTFTAGAGGSLTGEASQTVSYGSSCSAVTAVPAPGFTFLNWTGPGFATTTANPLTVGGVTSNLALTANFTPQSFTVNFMAGVGGSLTGVTSQQVTYGAACTPVTAVPAAGYSFGNWTGSGFATTAANPLTIGNVTANLTVTANFLAPPPSVTSFLPASGGAGSGVVITGTGLLGATAVAFNGTSAAAFTVNSATQITATVPAGATSGPISVVTAGGTGVSAGTFTISTSTLDFTVPTVYIVQVTQTPQFDVPLVQGRNGYLRAFVTANQANTAAPQVRVRFYDAGGGLLQTMLIDAPGASVPLSVEEGQLGKSWTAAIPGTYLQPGTRLLVDVDPGGAILESNKGNNTWPASGTPQALDVRNLQPFHLTFVPVTTTDGTGNVTAGNMASFTVTAKKLHPFPSLDLALRGSPMNSSTRTLHADNGNNDWQNVLEDLTALRNTDPGGTSRYYYGVVKTSYNSGIIGRSWIPATSTMATTSYRAALGWDKLPSGDSAAAHELGHSLGRPHAPGCGVAGPDPAWPAGSNYAGGLIGVWGLDPNGPTLYNPATTYDHMNYCDPDWVSDYGYKKVLSNREISPIGLASPTAEDPARKAPPHSLLVWGRLEDGQAVLFPAFHLPVEPQPPAPGDHALAGYDAHGGKVFEVTFDPATVADSPRPQWGLNFTLPLSPADAARLVELRWTKAGELLARQGGPALAPLQPLPPPEPILQVLPEGRTRLLWDATTHPMVLVKDRATGLGLGFGRNGDVSFEAIGAELEVHFSNGVRSQSLVLRHPRPRD